MDGYEPSTYGDRFADVYDDWYADVTDADSCADRLAELARQAGGGPVLELGVGSGRLALPLARRGVEVHGIDASDAMLDLLRAKPGAGAIRLTLGDMADLALADPPPFSVVFVAFNTFFNLGSEEAQRRCLGRVATLLAPDGLFVIEAFVPASDAPTGAERGTLAVREIGVDEVVLTVSRHDGTSQTITGQHVHLSAEGIRLRPWHLRYAPPDELDRLAADAGLELRWRAATWGGAPFDEDSGVHVSAYGRGNVRSVPPAATAPR